MDKLFGRAVRDDEGVAVVRAVGETDIMHAMCARIKILCKNSEKLFQDH